jgi:glyoxylase-like metal-dependent hydrolase (beta-lactamase superfamily II)
MHKLAPPQRFRNPKAAPQGRSSRPLMDVVGIVRLNFAQRVKLYDGPAELSPGITLHPVGGHTPGMQFVRVHTSRGWVVLASDVTHYYENMEMPALHCSVQHR